MEGFLSENLAKPFSCSIFYSQEPKKLSNRSRSKSTWSPSTLRRVWLISLILKSEIFILKLYKKKKAYNLVSRQYIPYSPLYFLLHGICLGPLVSTLSHPCSCLFSLVPICCDEPDRHSWARPVMELGRMLRLVVPLVCHSRRVLFPQLTCFSSCATRQSRIRASRLEHKVTIPPPQR